MAIGNLLTVDEVAEIIKVTRGRVHQFVMEGRLKPDGRVGKSLLFKRQSIDKFASQPRKTGRPTAHKKTSKK